MITDQRELYRRAAAGFGLRVHAVGPHQWGLTTACGKWNVRALVNHGVGENRWVPELFAGHTVDDVGDRLDGDLLGDDPVAAWDESISASLAALTPEDSLDRVVHLSFGDVPAREYVTQLFADLLVHRWDLAHAIAADEHLEDELVTACSAWFAGVADQYRSAGVIGPPVGTPATADAQSRLLADFGRNPFEAAAHRTAASPPHDPGEWWCLECAQMHRGSHHRRRNASPAAGSSLAGLATGRDA